VPICMYMNVDTSGFVNCSQHRLHVQQQVENVLRFILPQGAQALDRKGVHITMEDL